MKGISNNKIIRVCVSLTILTSSFDVFLNLQIGGLSFRFSQFAILPVIVLFFFENKLVGNDWKLSKDDAWFVLWVIVQFCFVFRSPNLKNAIGYWLWLLLDTLMIFSIRFFCGREYSFRWLLRTYLNAFTFVGAFGLLQFVLYPTGMHLLVTQAWIKGKWVRINGFSYEPSFFSTYMLVGFVVLTYLAEFEDKTIFTKKELRVRQLIVATAIVLSTSRMGWLMVSGYVIIRTRILM